MLSHGSGVCNECLDKFKNFESKKRLSPGKTPTCFYGAFPGGNKHLPRLKLICFISVQLLTIFLISEPILLPSKTLKTFFKILKN